jgi:hypothetical protein
MRQRNALREIDDAEEVHLQAQIAALIGQDAVP